MSTCTSVFIYLYQCVCVCVCIYMCVYISFPDPKPSQTQSPPPSTSCTTVVHLLQSMNQHWHIIISQSPCFTFEFSLDIVHSIGFDKCIMTCIHSFLSYRIVSLPKNSSVLYLFTSAYLWNPGNHWLCFLYNFVFLEYHIFRIIQHEAFENCLFSLSNTHSTSFHSW